MLCGGRTACYSLRAYSEFNHISMSPHVDLLDVVVIAFEFGLQPNIYAWLCSFVDGFFCYTTPFTLALAPLLCVFAPSSCVCACVCVIFVLGSLGFWETFIYGNASRSSRARFWCALRVKDSRNASTRSPLTRCALFCFSSLCYALDIVEWNGVRRLVWIEPSMRERTLKIFFSVLPFVNRSRSKTRFSYALSSSSSWSCFESKNFRYTRFFVFRSHNQLQIICFSSWLVCSLIFLKKL